MKNPWIFLSYRRAGSVWAARQIAAALETHCGDGMVFFDTRSIAESSDWDRAIEKGLEGSQVLVALIDSSWQLERLAVPDDWVRRELEWAIGHGLMLVPIVIDGANMPAAGDLPDSVTAFSKVQAFFVDGRSERVFQASIRVVAEHILQAIRADVQMVRQPEGWWKRIEINRWSLYLDGNPLVSLNYEETSVFASVPTGPHKLKIEWSELETSTRVGQAYGPGYRSGGETTKEVVLRPGRYVIELRRAPEIPDSRGFLRRIGDFLSAEDATPRRIEMTYHAPHRAS